MFSLLIVVLLFSVWSDTSTQSSPLLQPVTEPTYHGEGCVWNPRDGAIYYVDILKQLVKRYDVRSGNLSTIHLDGGAVSLVLPIADARHQFLVTRGRDILSMQWDGHSSKPTGVRVLATVDNDKPQNLFNDGKADAFGRLWVGSVGPQPTPGNVVPYQGSLYSMDLDSNSVVKHLGNLSVSNGLIWSSDNEIMYFIDSSTHKIEAFNFNLIDASIRNRRTIFDFEEYNLTGIPDGMTIDANGNLWVANFNGGKVLNVNPKTGELIRVIDFPVSLVSDVVFGDYDLSTLYVTTSQYGLSSEELASQPLAGALFKVTGLGVRGLPLPELYRRKY